MTLGQRATIDHHFSRAKGYTTTSEGLYNYHRGEGGHLTGRKEISETEGALSCLIPTHYVLPCLDIFLLQQIAQWIKNGFYFGHFNLSYPQPANFNSKLPKGRKKYVRYLLLIGDHLKLNHNQSLLGVLFLFINNKGKFSISSI